MQFGAACARLGAPIRPIAGNHDRAETCSGPPASGSSGGGRYLLEEFCAEFHWEFLQTIVSQYASLGSEKRMWRVHPTLRLGARNRSPRCPRAVTRAVELAFRQIGHD